MINEAERILFSEEQIIKRVKEMGEEISRDYSGRTPLLLGVLKGSFVFLADLMRRIEMPCEVQFIAASSYGNSADTSGTVDIAKTLKFDIKNRDVIIVEDILDTGVTLTALKEYLKALNPNSVKICAFLDKAERRTADISAEYVGFVCPNDFVVGYGLDYAERFRNLPYIASLKPEVYS